MSIDIAAMTAALEPTRKGLEAAGFELALDDAQGKLRITVKAGAEACEDCLVPKSLFRQMADDEIREAGLPKTELEILYPLDSRPKR
jgi:hypothetical protein